jgi:hypothetical protein
VLEGLNVDALVADTISSRPDVVSATEAVAAAQERLRLARIGWIRFLGIADATSGRKTGHELSPAFRITIPLFNRNEGGIARAEATVLGIAARNGIMMVSHYRHLEESEDEPFGFGLVLRGAEERLTPIVMTALATGLALLPLVISGKKPGHEIEYPLAVVILGGLITSTVLNLFLLPPLYAAFGKRGQ